jgi:hypothetical protein
MPIPSEHKTVQTRILKYAQEIGWTYVPRAEAEARRGFDLDGASPEERARKASVIFGSPGCQLMTSQLRVHNLDLYDLGLMNREQRSNTFSAVE